MLLIRVVFSVALFVVPAALAQQQITIKALDARNGQPLKDIVIDVWFGERVSGLPRQSRTGPDGTSLITVPEGEKTFVAAGEVIADCRGGNVAGKSFIDRNVYSVDEVPPPAILARTGKAAIKQPNAPASR